jgi:hypothetical protein
LEQGLPTQEVVEGDAKCEEVICIDSCDDHPVSLRTVLPPDLVSASSGSCDDGSVSSLSSDEETAPLRRSIFSSHWKAEGKRQTSMRARALPTADVVTTSCPFSEYSDDETDFDENASGNTYERTLRKQEGIKASSEKVDRRKIFAGCINSDPIFFERSNCFRMNSPLSEMTRRHAFSDSALVVKKPSSCLRSPRYAGDESARHSTDSSQSVSFAASVTVIKFKVPQEQWASSGWSSFFH